MSSASWGAPFTLTPSATSVSRSAVVVMDQPTGSLNVGPEESFQLQAHVTSPAYTFAYRWSVYRSDDAVMRWPVATLGYDDANVDAVQGDQRLDWHRYCYSLPTAMANAWFSCLTPSVDSDPMKSVRLDFEMLTRASQ